MKGMLTRILRIGRITGKCFQDAFPYQLIALAATCAQQAIVDSENGEFRVGRNQQFTVWRGIEGRLIDSVNHHSLKPLVTLWFHHNGIALHTPRFSPNANSRVIASGQPNKSRCMQSCQTCFQRAGEGVALHYTDAVRMMCCMHMESPWTTKYCEVISLPECGTMTPQLTG
jgi:hypothetical protein